MQNFPESGIGIPSPRAKPLIFLGYNPPYGKRWRLNILPQFLSNVTRAITHKVIIFFFFWGGGAGANSSLLYSNIAYPRFEVYKTFFVRFYEQFYGFHALRTVGKCTSRHHFKYGGFLRINSRRFAYGWIVQFCY